MTGKWSQAGVPQKGWTCEGLEDLGSPDAVCEMCEVQEIRYVHTMSHPGYDLSLGVGCVCAEKMEEDYLRPRQREKALRNVVSRKRRWLGRHWRTSASGESSINADGFNVTISRNSDGTWGGKIEERVTKRSITARRKYDSENNAKLAAFDGMVFLKTKRGWGATH